MRRDIYRLALGQCDSPPFRKGLIDEAKKTWLRRLAKDSGMSIASLAVTDDEEPFALAELHEHLKIIKDPEAKVFGEGPGTFKSGMPLGVEGMPRVPEVFEARKKL